MELITKINTEIINPLILLLAGFSVLVFLYGVFEMIKAGAGEEARATGQKHVMWGVIGLFIIVAVFGIIHVICTTIGVDCL